MLKTYPKDGLKEEIESDIENLPLIARLMLSKAKPPSKKLVHKVPPAQITHYMYRSFTLYPVLDDDKRKVMDDIGNAYQEWKQKQEKLYNVVTSISDDRTLTEKQLEKEILQSIMDARLEDRSKQPWTMHQEKENVVEKFNEDQDQKLKN